MGPRVAAYFRFLPTVGSVWRRTPRPFDRHADRVRAVLLDMTMPRLDGEETFLELRRRRADLPVVLTSGYAEPELLRRPTRGPATFIQKPYRAAELVDTLLELI